MWNSLDIIELDEQWVNSNPIDSSYQYFRFTLLGFKNKFPYLICQKEQDIVFQPVKLYARSEREVIHFQKPPFFDNRVIATKRLWRQGSYPFTVEMLIEGWQS